MDRAKAFYAEQAGFHVDVDHRAGADFRVVQLTPPGSACSISFGVGISDYAPFADFADPDGNTGVPEEARWDGATP